MRVVVIVMLVLIVGSLGSALWFLIRDKGTTERTVKALTVRISLSIGLFLLLMAGYYLGLIPKTGLH
ncbi:MAG TPA: twin transmembrane helix small protein [Burkholderiales bacterium]|nr:twin transmembrane helix small protein [Burkholderiales bacterium]